MKNIIVLNAHFKCFFYIYIILVIYCRVDSECKSVVLNNFLPSKQLPQFFCNVKCSATLY